MEMSIMMVRIVGADGLVLKHQAISIHNADFITVVYDHRNKKRILLF